MIAVLQPPNPEAVFKNVCNGFLIVLDKTLMDWVTPNVSKPKDLYKVLFFKGKVSGIISSFM